MYNHTCQRCGHTWESTKEHPQYCPQAKGGCNSPFWDTLPKHETWTDAEIEMAMNHEVPPGRTKIATDSKRYREKKDN